MRPDGTRVKNLPPLVAAIPYIMPKRYDAWNTITENIDEESCKQKSIAEVKKVPQNLHS